MTATLLAVAATLTITGSIRLIYIAGYRRGMQRERERDRALRMGAALRSVVPHRHDEYGHIVVSPRAEARN